MAASRARTEWIGFSTIVIREFNRIVRIWGQTIVPPTVTATLYFVIFGSLIGKRVGLVGGYDYMQFIAPGLIMMTVITNSFGNVVSSFFGAKFGKHLEELLVSPMPNWLILSGYVAGGMRAGHAGRVGRHHRGVVLHAPRRAAFFRDRLRRAADQRGLLPRRLRQCVVCQEFRSHLLVPHLRARAAHLSGRGILFDKMLPGWAQIISHANPILYMVSAFRYGFLGSSDVDLRLAYGIMVLAAVSMFMLALFLLNKGAGIRD